MAPVPAMARKFETCPVKTPLTLDRGVLVMFPSDLTWPAGFCTITYQIYHIPHMFIQHQSQHCGNDPYESLGRKKKLALRKCLSRQWSSEGIQDSSQTSKHVLLRQLQAWFCSSMLSCWWFFVRNRWSCSSRQSNLAVKLSSSWNGTGSLQVAWWNRLFWTNV